jgi:hypothetical protein
VSSLQFLTRKEVDVLKWDETISASTNSLPYAFSWYLDLVAEHWDALIFGNYEAVMPLVWTRKFGVKCLYQPYYCQQLGVFGNQLSKKVQHEFLTHITKEYSYVNINLNPGAQVLADDFNLKPKKNLLLDLSFSYSELRKNYSENHRRSIQKAIKVGTSFFEKTDLPGFQKFYLENVNRKKENYKSKHEKIFKSLTKALLDMGMGKIFSATGISGELLASSLVIRHGDRIINIINTSSSAGKRSGASHFLFDCLIQQHSANATILDFEGSSIPGIARFYEGFGAMNQTFFNYQTSILERQKQRFQ